MYFLVYLYVLLVYLRLLFVYLCQGDVAWKTWSEKPTTTPNKDHNKTASSRCPKKKDRVTTKSSTARTLTAARGPGERDDGGTVTVKPSRTKDKASKKRKNNKRKAASVSESEEESEIDSGVGLGFGKTTARAAPEETATMDSGTDSENEATTGPIRTQFNTDQHNTYSYADKNSASSCLSVCCCCLC